MTEELRDEMLDHAVRGLPYEACGLFAAASQTSQLERFFPMRNAAASSQLYKLDGTEMMTVEQEADEVGLQVVGVMHSHTHTVAYPSPTDVSEAAVFDPFGSWNFVIVSLKDDSPVLRNYRIVDGIITETEVVVTPRAAV